MIELKEVILRNYVRIEDGRDIPAKAQLIYGKWFIARWGCHTIERILDELEEIGGRCLMPKCTCNETAIDSCGLECPIHGNQ
jgi:hypothetical protein